MNHASKLILSILIIGAGLASTSSLISCDGGGEDIYDTPSDSNSVGGIDTTNTGGSDPGTGGAGAHVNITIDFTDQCMEYIANEGQTCHNDWYMTLADGLIEDQTASIQWDLSSSPEGFASFSNVPSGSYDVTVDISVGKYVDEAIVIISSDEADQGVIKSEVITITSNDYWCGD